MEPRSVLARTREKLVRCVLVPCNELLMGAGGCDRAAKVESDAGTAGSRTRRARPASGS